MPAQIRAGLYVTTGLLIQSLALGVPGASAPVAAPSVRSAAETARIVRLRAMMDSLRPLHERPAAPQAGEWLAEHREAGQTFSQYLAGKPVIPDARRRYIDIQLLGEMTPAQHRIITLTGDYMQRFFNLKIRLRPALPLSLIPDPASRRSLDTGSPQLLTSYILNEILKQRLASDAVASIAFTATDLWPGEGWNFVFGQAMLHDRVGVWSIARFGDPGKSPEDFQRALLRTLKIAVHETGHMLSMAHCTAYRCVMAGTNSLSETDRAPLWLCPECLAKLLWATGADPLARFRTLRQFCRDHHLNAQAEFFQHSLDRLNHRRLGTQ